MSINNKSAKSSIKQIISNAERLLPGIPAPDNEPDKRWQAIIAVGEYIETEPHEVWRFIRKWGKHPSDDVRLAVATCLLEHLLEHHFDDFFPMVKKECRQSKLFADTFKMCWQYGQAEQNENSDAFTSLKSELD